MTKKDHKKLLDVAEWEGGLIEVLEHSDWR
jgi:hypothetical protein